MIRIPRTDLDIFPLNLGGNTFGWTSDRDTSFAVLDAFVEAGGNFIDTADLYSVWAEGHEGGESEQILGEWLQARGNRDDVIIATKVGGLPSRPGLREANVEAALDESLKRLNTDYIDIYYAHYDDEKVDVINQVLHAEALVESGKVKHLGLSNYSPARMRQWFEVAYAGNHTIPVAIQPQYNLLNRREFEQSYLSIAQDYDAAIFPYFALASGVLTGKYRSKADIQGQAREDFVKDLMMDESLQVVDVVVEIAEARAVEPATVTLAWLLAKDVTAPVASASTPEQLPALMAAAELKLSDDEVQRLDTVSKPFA